LIGVYGGTFDPVHEGHLGTATEAGELAGCERVLMIPAAEPPGKAVPRATGQQRYEMLRLALADWPTLQLEGCELTRSGPSYTVDTLRMLREREEGCLLLILGSDAFLNLSAWYCWQEIFQLAHILVAGRPGVPCEPTGELAREFTARRILDPAQFSRQDSGLILESVLTQYPLSSTQIRAELARGALPVGLPKAVADYINTLNLYTE